MLSSKQIHTGVAVIDEDITEDTTATSIIMLGVSSDFDCHYSIIQLWPRIRLRRRQVVVQVVQVVQVPQVCQI